MKRTKKEKLSKSNVMKRVEILILSIFFLLIIASGLALIVFDKYFKNDKTPAKQYSHRYVMVTPDTSDSFVQEVYDYAQKKANEDDAYVELICDQLKDTYSIEDKLKIAIATNPEGILLMSEATDSSKELINEAVKNGIPVVSIMSACTNAKYCSFVGPNYYDYGRTYGRILKPMKNDKSSNVAVVMSGQMSQTDKNNIYAGLREEIKSCENAFNVKVEFIDSRESFEVEEKIRTLILDDKNPIDIIICIDENATKIAYQSVIDYNKVGKVNIIGSFANDNILRGVSRNIIDSTVVIDTKQMGEYAVSALREYIDSGFVSNYVSVDITVINKDNIGEYYTEE